METDVAATLAAEAREALRAAIELFTKHARAAGGEPRAGAARASAQVEQSLTRERLVIALVGATGAGKSSFVNRVLGEELLSTANRPCTPVATLVRRGSVYDYSARFADGNVEQFALASPDRDALFVKSLQTAEGALAAAAETLRGREGVADAARHEAEDAKQRVIDLEADLQRARSDGTRAEEAVSDHERAEETHKTKRLPNIPNVYLRTIPWWGVWWWLLRLLLWPYWRAPLRLHRAVAKERAEAIARQHAFALEATNARQSVRSLEEPLARAKVRSEEATGNLTRSESECEPAAKEFRHAQSHLDRVKDEREKFARERKSSFATAVRTMTDREGSRRPVELAVDCPARDLPPDLSLLDTPGFDRAMEWQPTEKVVLRDADACLLLVLPGRDPTVRDAAVERLERTVPLVVTLSRETDGRPVLETLVRRRRSILALRAADIACACLRELKPAVGRAEEVYRRRLASIAQQTIPEPAAFRERQVDSMAGEISEAAQNVIRSGTAVFHEAIEELRRKWGSEIEAAADRTAVDRCLAGINETAPAHLSAALERMSESIAGAVWHSVDVLEAKALEEIRKAYQVAYRLQAESLVAVATEVTRDDFEAMATLQPIVGVLEAFEKQRVGYGLSGAAAGAVVGTLIVPGIGTAIGAFLGTLAGFLKGIDSLKRDCVTKVGECLIDADEQVTAELARREAEVVKTIRTSLDEALDRAFVRLRAAIERLREMERTTTEAQRAMLADLLRGCTGLEEREARIARQRREAALAIPPTVPPLAVGA